jgi:flagellar FliL protein
MVDVVPEDKITDVVEEGKNKKPSNKLILILSLIILILLVAVGGLLFINFKNKSSPAKTKESSQEEVEDVEPKELKFAALPEILVNLRSQSGKSNFLKLTLVLETGSEEDAQKVDKAKPLIIDQFQIFLRELDVEDLKGSAGIQRIRQELLSRANSIVQPGKVRNVLFKEFLVQ